MPGGKASQSPEQTQAQDSAAQCSSEGIPEIGTESEVIRIYCLMPSPSSVPRRNEIRNITDGNFSTGDPESKDTSSADNTTLGNLSTTDSETANISIEVDVASEECKNVALTETIIEDTVQSYLNQNKDWQYLEISSSSDDSSLSMEDEEKEVLDRLMESFLKVKSGFNDTQNEKEIRIKDTSNKIIPYENNILQDVNLMVSPGSPAQKELMDSLGDIYYSANESLQDPGTAASEKVTHHEKNIGTYIVKEEPEGTSGSVPQMEHDENTDISQNVDELELSKIHYGGSLLVSTSAHTEHQLIVPDTEKTTVDNIISPHNVYAELHNENAARKGSGSNYFIEETNEELNLLFSSAFEENSFQWKSASNPCVDKHLHDSPTSNSESSCQNESEQVSSTVNRILKQIDEFVVKGLSTLDDTVGISSALGEKCPTKNFHKGAVGRVIQKAFDEMQVTLLSKDSLKDASFINDREKDPQPAEKELQVLDTSVSLDKSRSIKTVLEKELMEHEKSNVKVNARGIDTEFVYGGAKSKIHCITNEVFLDHTGNNEHKTNETLQHPDSLVCQSEYDGGDLISKKGMQEIASTLEETSITLKKFGLSCNSNKNHPNLPSTSVLADPNQGGAIPKTLFSLSKTIQKPQYTENVEAITEIVEQFFSRNAPDVIPQDLNEQESKQLIHNSYLFGDEFSASVGIWTPKDDLEMKEQEIGEQESNVETGSLGNKAPDFEESLEFEHELLSTMYKHLPRKLVGKPKAILHPEVLPLGGDPFSLPDIEVAQEATILLPEHEQNTTVSRQGLPLEPCQAEPDDFTINSYVWDEPTYSLEGTDYTPQTILHNAWKSMIFYLRRSGEWEGPKENARHQLELSNITDEEFLHHFPRVRRAYTDSWEMITSGSVSDLEIECKLMELISDAGFISTSMLYVEMEEMRNRATEKLNVSWSEELTSFPERLYVDYVNNQRIKRARKQRRASKVTRDKKREENKKKRNKLREAVNFYNYLKQDPRFKTIHSREKTEQSPFSSHASPQRQSTKLPTVQSQHSINVKDDNLSPSEGQMNLQNAGTTEGQITNLNVGTKLPASYMNVDLLKSKSDGQGGENWELLDNDDEDAQYLYSFIDPEGNLRYVWFLESESDSDEPSKFSVESINIDSMKIKERDNFPNES